MRNFYGPWELEESALEVIDKDGDLIVDAGSGDYLKEKATELGRLIAAAPELLEALQEMVAIVKKHTYPQPDKPSSTWGRMEAAEAVIARVLGQ